MIVLCLSLLAGCSDAIASGTEKIEPPAQTETQRKPTEQKPAPEAKAISKQVQSAESIDIPSTVDETASDQTEPEAAAKEETTPVLQFSLDLVPDYSGAAYVAINGNVPYFTAGELTETSFERYSELDGLGRCGVAAASIGTDLMPTEERGAIGSVKPSGWHTIRYNGLVDGNYLYNRCHLIGYQLSGENANVKNLITGTRYLNIEGMLPFENLVADYVKETENHVMYRVTPVFDGSDLLARGVLMEGYSVEDGGKGVCFCVFAYNVQPGITIDYATGDSVLAGEASMSLSLEPVQEPTNDKEETPISPDSEPTYILNKNTKKFHKPNCSSVDDMKESNKKEFFGTRDEAIADGYSPCGRCNP